MSRKDHIVIARNAEKIKNALKRTHTREFDHGHSRETPVCGNIKRVWPTIKVL